VKGAISLGAKYIHHIPPIVEMITSPRKRGGGGMAKFIIFDLLKTSPLLLLLIYIGRGIASNTLEAKIIPHRHFRQNFFSLS